MIKIQNIEYVKPYMILKFDVISGIYQDVCSHEVAPANIVNNQWVHTSPDDFNVPEIKELIVQAQKKWKKSIVDKYKKSRESELVLSYSERTLTDEEFAEILKIAPPDHLFHPNQLFIDKMKELFSGRHVIECGAGNGYTGRVLSEAGFDVTCVDKLPSLYYEYPVTIMNALDFEFDSSMVCLICRPDKDDWFLQTMENALANGCPVVYVRKKDIYSLDAELIAEKVGMDDEYMFAIKL